MNTLLHKREYLPPLIELLRDLFLQAVLGALEHSIQLFVLSIGLEPGTLGVHLLEHLHEYLGAHNDFLHGLVFLSDIVTLVLPKKRTIMTDFALASDTDEF